MITYNSMDEAYYRIFDDIKKWGYEYTPRGQACVELRPHSFKITHPELSLYTGASRKLNYRFFVIETLGYLAGLDSRWFADLMMSVNSNMKNWVGSDGSLTNAYGPRLFNSLPRVINQLKEDPDTRQAVASIWNSNEETNALNLPCTVALHFMTHRDPPTAEYVLDLNVYMRSNDVNWGLPYDVPAFCTILDVVAHFAGYAAGNYNHTAGSLHYYQQTPPNILEHETETSNLALPMLSYQKIDDPMTFGEFRQACANLLWDVYEQRILNKKTWKTIKCWQPQTQRQSPYAYWFEDMGNLLETNGI